MMIPYAGQIDGPDHYCVLDLETASIAEVTATIKHGKVFQIQFSLKENWLKLGDVMLCLGTPQKHQNGHTTSFSWRGSGVYALAQSNRDRFDPLIPLSMVSFTDSRSSGLESLEVCLQNAW